MLGRDFLVFYTGGNLARTGRSSDLYDLAVVQAGEKAAAASNGWDIGGQFGPWWNPPFAAWMFAPLSAMTFHNALLAWWAISGVALAGSIVLLCRMLPVAPESSWIESLKTRALVPLLIFGAAPTWQAFGHGQNTFVSLFLITATVWFWRTERPLAAGLVAGMLAYKPQLGLVIAAVLVVTMGWRAMAGLAITGSALLLVTLISMPGTLGLFLHQLPINLRHLQVEQIYIWHRHVTFKAFWRWLIQGRTAGEMGTLTTLLWLGCEVTLGVAIGWAAFGVARMRRHGHAISCDRVIAAALAAAPLLMPFYFDYDLVLLAVPATVAAADAIRTGPSRPMLRAWMMVFIVIYFSVPLADHSRIISSVIALSALSVILVRRAVVPSEVAHAANLTLREGDSLPIAA